VSGHADFAEGIESSNREASALTHDAKLFTSSRRIETQLPG